jgi:hypothetical protein
MFVRFVVTRRAEELHSFAGVFGAAYDLCRRARLRADEQHELEDLLAWFKSHLPVPDRFSRSRRRGARCVAICWLKERATRHFEKLRDLTTLLDRHGVVTRRLRTNRPGYLVYEDRYQIAAVPFRDTGA